MPGNVDVSYPAIPLISGRTTPRKHQQILPSILGRPYTSKKIFLRFVFSRVGLTSIDAVNFFK